jgi:hypothetical protein
MDRKLYNGGDRLKERLLYTIKPEGPKDGHSWNAYKDIDAPPHSFFVLPDEIPAPSKGVARVPVYFHQDMALKHGHRGIVLIDPDMATDVDDDTPFARNEDEAKEKGERLWLQHLHNTVQRHLDYCADARAMGGAPKAASAFTRHAFKMLGLIDPATTIFEQNVVRNAKSAEPSAPAREEKSGDSKKEVLQVRGQLLAEKRRSQLLQAKLDAIQKAQQEEAIKEKLATSGSAEI